MTFFMAVLVGSFWSLSLPNDWAQSSVGNISETQACDMLASDPLDQERPAYANGIPATINNPGDAMKVCGLAAAKFRDNVRLKHNLGRAYSQNGFHNAAFLNFMEAAAAGYPASMLAVAEYLLDSPTPADRAEGRDWLIRARKHPYPAANYAFALELERGRGGPRDLAAARYEYTIAADRGFIDALVDLGRMYGMGLGGPRDEVKARDYYRRAASRGNIVAMNNLGHMLWRGEGGLADPREARELIERSAGADFAPALNNLAIMLWRGVGGSRDPRAALKVFEAAAPRYTAAWTNMAALHLSGDLGASNVDGAILAYLNAAKAGANLAPHISAWLDSKIRKQETNFACMLIALTIVDDKSGSQIIEQIVDRGDPFHVEISKVLGAITTSDILIQLQQHNTLLKLIQKSE